MLFHDAVGANHRPGFSCGGDAGGSDRPMAPVVVAQGGGVGFPPSHAHSSAAAGCTLNRGNFVLFVGVGLGVLCKVSGVCACFFVSDFGRFMCFVTGGAAFFICFRHERRRASNPERVRAPAALSCVFFLFVFLRQF